jgi:hypothetical protein
VSYYSDPRDTVPHTPEICYRQGGSVVRSIEVVDVEVPGLETGPEVIAAKMIEFTPVLLIGDEAVVPDRSTPSCATAVSMLIASSCGG